MKVMKSSVSVLFALLLTNSLPSVAQMVDSAGVEQKITAPVFMDHMVLQRDKPVPVWGYVKPGEEVTVEFAGQKKTAQADAVGKWMVKLDRLEASAEPRVLVVQCKARKLKSVFNGVLVGDVWLCSGQSNMWFPVRDARDGEKEIAAASDPSLRLCVVEGNWTLEPASGGKGFKSGWQPCSPQSVEHFCAAGYYFGRELRRELRVPIGLIQCSWPGTPAEAWTRREALRAIPTLSERAEKEIAQFRSQEDDNRKFVVERAAWEERYGVKPPPIADTAHGWADPALDVSGWISVTLPATWRKLGASSGGAFWLRKEVNLPASAAGKPFGLALGWIGEQYDTAFFDGVEVGHFSNEAPAFYNGGRKYRIPGNLVKEERNVIALRVVSATEGAQVGCAGYSLGLPVADPMSVDSHWLMKVETAFPPLPADALTLRPRPNSTVIQHVSGSLYNGMLSPIIPFAIKGTIWYQGEDNAGRPQEYRDLLSVMIHDWRAQWGQGDFPFIIQQLVNYGAPVEDPGNPGKWPLMREAQEQVAGTIPNCGLAVGIEIGEALDIHPKSKQEVGVRLALVALEKVYARNIESSGPRFALMKVEGCAIRVTFSHAKGLSSRNGPAKNFAIAGADKKFIWAEARIQGDSVVISSSQVSTPVAVRYAWVGNPAGCNLYNSSGLPMAPFRTDEWN